MTLLRSTFRGPARSTSSRRDLLASTMLLGMSLSAVASSRPCSSRSAASAAAQGASLKCPPSCPATCAGAWHGPHRLRSLPALGPGKSTPAEAASCAAPWAWPSSHGAPGSGRPPSGRWVLLRAKGGHRTPRRKRRCRRPSRVRSRRDSAAPLGRGGGCRRFPQGVRRLLLLRPRAALANLASAVAICLAPRPRSPNPMSPFRPSEWRPAHPRLGVTPWDAPDSPARLSSAFPWRRPP
eukprot:scaffold1499_cov255-Pinguiococcus_pyrenoidosus.AAC.10